MHQEIKVELSLETTDHCCPWPEMPFNTEAKVYSSLKARQWREVGISDGTEREVEGKVGWGRLKCFIP